MLSASSGRNPRLGRPACFASVDNNNNNDDDGDDDDDDGADDDEEESRSGESRGSKLPLFPSVLLYTENLEPV